MPKLIKLQPSLIVFAFFGGAALSLSELMSMFAKHQGADLFFLGGMIIAGILGIGGAIIAGAENIKTAFTSGVAAPQLLSGLLKAGVSGTTVVGCVISSIIPSVYAQTDSAKRDSVRIYVNMNYEDPIQLKTADGKIIELKNNDTITIEATQQATVIAGEFEKEIQLSRKNNLSVSYSRPLLQKASQLSRGMFGQKLIDVKPKIVVESDTTK